MKSIFLFLTIIICNFSFAQKPTLITQEKNLGVITCIKYSSDGRYIASGSDGDYKVKIWDVQSGKLVGTLSGHTKSINDIDFHPSGDILVSVSADMKNYVWDLNTWTVKDSIDYTSEILKISHTSDGKKILAASKSGEIMYFNAPEYGLVTQIGKMGGTAKSLDTKGNIVAASSSHNDLMIFDINSGELLKKIKPLGGMDIVGVSIIDSKLVYGSVDGKVRVLDLATFENILTFKAHASILTMGANAKRNIVATAGNDRSLIIWDLKDGSMIASFKNAAVDDKGRQVVEKIRQVVFSPEGGMLATSGYKNSVLGKAKSRDNTIKLYDVDRKRVYKVLKGEVTILDTYCFHTVENYFYTVNDSLLKVWDLDKGESIGNVIFHKKMREKAIVEDNGAKGKKNKVLNKLNRLKKMALYGDADTPDLSLEKIRQNTIEKGQNLAKNITTRGNRMYVSAKGKYMLTKFEKDEYRLYDLKDGIPEYKTFLKSNIKGGINSVAMSPNEDVVVFVGGGISGISVLDLETGKLDRVLHSPRIDRGIFEARTVSFSRDGKLLAVISNLGVVTIWETTGWGEITTIDLKGGVKSRAYVHFSDNSDELYIQTLIGVFLIDLKTFIPKRLNSEIEGNPISLNQPTDYIVSKNKKGLYFYNTKSKEKSQMVDVDVKSINHIEMNKYGFLGASMKSGELKIIDPKTGKERFVMVSEGDNAIFKTLDNYYKITKEGTDLVTFRVGKDAYPFEQFDAKFNRPDIVLKAMNSEDEGLVALYEKAYTKRLKKLGISEAELSGEMELPTVSILNRNKLPVVTTKRNISLELKAFDLKNDLSRINVWLNDVPVYGGNGIKVSGSQYSDDVDVVLASGLNKIQVSVTNSKGIESLKQTVEIDCDVELKRNLYVVSIGTSNYKDTRFNLNYAAKDANDLASLFKEGGDVYDNIYQKVLTNNEVIKDNFIGLKNFLNEAKIDDVVIVFIAGHGVLDSEFDYFYGTYNIDFENPRGNGLRYDEIEGILDGIKPLRKLLIMDTCNSGEVEKDEVEEAEMADLVEGDVQFRSVGGGVKNINEEGVSPSKMMKELFSDLRRGTGTTVITSAGGTEFAMESAEWKNGLFTYCLISGLRNRTADLNKDGKIMLSELQLYVTDKVSKLSHGRQVPTSRIQNIALDYQIW